MRQLTREEIDRYASRPGADALAVANALGSIRLGVSLPRLHAIAYQEAREYRQNYPTLAAILDGLTFAVTRAAPMPPSRDFVCVMHWNDPDEYVPVDIIEAEHQQALEDEMMLDAGQYDAERELPAIAAEEVGS